MDREYPFLFCSKSGFWLEYQMMRQNIFEKQKRQTPKMTFVYILTSSSWFLFFDNFVGNQLTVTNLFIAFSIIDNLEDGFKGNTTKF